MAVDKLVDSTQLDSDLTSVANAIRTRGGTSAQLAFPNGFVSAVGAIGNQYSAADEGKVVSSGALVSQTAHADVTPTTSDQTIDTTTNNSIKVKGDADLVAGNIKKDVEIFGVTGTYEGGGGGGSSPVEVTVASAKSGSAACAASLLNAANATIGKTYVINAKTLASPTTSQLFKAFYICIWAISESSVSGLGGIIRNNSSGTTQSIAWGNAQGTIAVGDVYTVAEVNTYPTL